MAKPTEQSGESFMLKLARFIVDKRNLVFLVVIIGLIFSVFSRSWVQVENDLTAYLPADSETRQALDVMDEQFTTFGTASVMVANLPLADAFDLQEKLEDVEGVQGVAFDETDEHYNNVSALFSVTFDYDEDDTISGDLVISLDTVRSNAELFGKTYEEELYRVIIHGILHLCGINDKGPGEREMMEAAENKALAMLSLAPMP